MSVTVADLLNEELLDLTCVTGYERLGREIRWVHVSEIGDPSPWLTGSELLLTTGLIERSDDAVMSLFESLAAQGIAAVGFGVGFVFSALPQIWLDGARKFDIPLLEVPLSTPYIAIAEFVSRRIKVEEFTQVNRVLDVQQRLARSVQTPELLHDSLFKLARVLDATVLLQRANGDCEVHDGGAAFDPWELDSIRREMRAHVDSKRHSVTAAVGELYIHSSKAETSLLAVARKRRYSPLEQNIIGSVATVLRLPETSDPETSQTLREELAAQVASGETPASPRLMNVVFSSSRTSAVAKLAMNAEFVTIRNTASRLREALVSAFADALVWGHDESIVAMVPGKDASELSRVLSRTVDCGDALGGFWKAGISSTRPVEELHESLREATAALHIADRQAAIPVREYAKVPSNDHAARWIEQSRSDPLFYEWRRRLEAAEAGSLRLSGALLAFLRCNGAREHAANDIGVHRQTLNSRLVEVERILDISLESPGDRTLLWLAFETASESW